MEANSISSASPVKTVGYSDKAKNNNGGQISPNSEFLTGEHSPKLSPSPEASKLASKVRFIDGRIPRILHKGESLPGDCFADSSNRREALSLPKSSLNAGLSSGES